MSGISVVIPWCNREEVSESLVQNQWWMALHQAEVIVVNCGGDATKFRELITGRKFGGLRGIQVPLSAFNKSLALNIGVYCSNSPIVFILDADVVLRDDVLPAAVSAVEQGAFVTVDRLHETVPDPTFSQTASELHKCINAGSIEDIYITTFVEFKMHNGDYIRQRTFRRSLLNGSRAGAGQLIVQRKHLLEIGGYNSDLTFWGFEDNDVELRLSHLLKLPHLEMGSAFHLTHDDSRRNLGGLSRSESNLRNLNVSCAGYARGDFSGTYCRDSADWREKIHSIPEESGSAVDG